MTIHEYFEFCQGNILELRANSKMPKTANWTSSPCRILPDEAETYLMLGCNLGYRIAPDVLIIDVDPKNGGRDSFDLLPSSVHTLKRTVATPSGGFHIYTQLPPDFDCRTLKTTSPEFPGIDFLHHGRQVVAPGSTLNGGLSWVLFPEASLPLEETPPDLLHLLTKPVPATTTDNPASMMGYLTPIELATLLQSVPVEDFSRNDEWLPLMFACHAATGGEGFEPFLAWCTSDPNFADHERTIRSRWSSATESAKREQPSITIRTLCSVIGKYRSGAPEWLLIRAGLMSSPTNFFDAASDNRSQTDMERLTHRVETEDDKMVLLHDVVIDVASCSTINDAVKESLYKQIAKRGGSSLPAIKKMLKLLRTERKSRKVSVQMDGPQGAITELEDNQIFLIMANRAIARLTIDAHNVAPIYTAGQWWSWCGTHWDGVVAEQDIKKIVVEVMTGSGIVVTPSAIAQVMELMTIDRTVPSSRLSPDVSRMRIFTKSSVITFNPVSGEWEEGKHSHLYNNPYVLATLYDKTVGPPSLWLKFLDEVMTSKKAQRTLACAIAYTATGCRPFLRKAFYVYGPPRSGKSTALELIESLIGEHNCSSLNIIQVGTRFGAAGLVGKLANISNETVGRKSIEDDIFKALVSGETISVEKKFCDQYSIKNIAKLFFASNNFPHINDESEAVWDRLIVLSFPKTFCKEEADLKLKYKLFDERMEILKWAMDIFAEEFVKDECASAMEQDAYGEEVMRQWRETNNPPLEWCRERVLTEPGDSITMDQAFEDYIQWCRDNAHRPTGKNHFSRHIKKVMPDSSMGKYGEVYFRGRKLRERQLFNGLE